MNYPEDIVNNMTLAELQNCDWDALFKQIQQPQYYIHQNYVDTNDQYHENRQVLHQNNNTVYETKNLMMNQLKNGLQNEKKQDIVIARKPIFIPLRKDGTCRAIEFRNALFLQSKFNFDDTPKLSLDEDKEKNDNIFDCKICDDKFQTRASLITHVKVHQQPFCALCLSPFKNMSDYRIHNSKLHNIQWIKQKQNIKNKDDDNDNDNDNDDDDEDDDTNEIEDRDDNENRRNSLDETKRNNLYDIYDNLTTITLTSKYGRRRKVLDMTAVITKKTRKSK